MLHWNKFTFARFKISNAKGSNPFNITHLVVIQLLTNILQLIYGSYSQYLSHKLLF